MALFKGPDGRFHDVRFRFERTYPDGRTCKCMKGCEEDKDNPGNYLPKLKECCAPNDPMRNREDVPEKDPEYTAWRRYATVRRCLKTNYYNKVL